MIKEPTLEQQVKVEGDNNAYEPWSIYESVELGYRNLRDSGQISTKAYETMEKALRETLKLPDDKSLPQ